MKIRKIVLGAAIVLIGIPVLLLATAAVVVQLLDKSDGTVVGSGEDREFLLHIPTSYNGTHAVPLVISLHAAAMWPAQQMNLSRWNRLADAEGFIVVYPSGRRRPKIWPDGLLARSGRDVTFIGALIDTLTARYRIDGARIYVNGMSNGGGMATVLGCHLADRIAAVGLVSSLQIAGSTACAAGRPMPMIAFHGGADEMAPYAGGPLGDPFSPVKEPLPAVGDWVQVWARRNQCPDSPAQASVAPDVSRLEYGPCAEGAAVVLYTLHGAGHTWPGGKPLPEWLAGVTNTRIDATRVMWEFFRGHPLPIR